MAQFDYEDIMFAQYVRTSANAFADRVSNPAIRSTSVLIAVALLLSACTETPLRRDIQSSNPDAAVTAVKHNSVVRGYLSQRPVEPGPWLEQNQNVAPRPAR